MKILKILIGISILFLLIGSVTATDINNLKVPDGWESIGHGNYHEIGESKGQGSGRNMILQKWYDGLKEEYYNNITEESYYVNNNGDNTYNYTDNMNGDYGCFEVVEIDGEKYFINFWSLINSELKKGAPTNYEVMMEFNKLNNLKPIEV